MDLFLCFFQVFFLACLSNMSYFCVVVIYPRALVNYTTISFTSLSSDASVSMRVVALMMRDSMVYFLGGAVMITC